MIYKILNIRNKLHFIINLTIHMYENNYELQSFIHDYNI